MKQGDVGTRTRSVEQFPVSFVTALGFNPWVHDDFVRELFPDIDHWRVILDRLEISLETAVRLSARANLNGTDFQTELLVSGLVTEWQVYSAIAAKFGIPFVNEFNPDRLILGADIYLPLLNGEDRYPLIKIEQRGGSVAFLIAPERLPLEALGRMLRSKPHLKPFLRMTTPGTLRRAVIHRARPLLSAVAKNTLYDHKPECSAKIVANAGQGLVLGIVIVVLMLGFTFEPESALVAVHVFFSMFFLACVGLRFAAARAPVAVAPDDLAQTPAEILPRYSVLVALHREAAVVNQLVEALERLVWPRSKLEIKLVCEADDRETIDALEAIDLPPHFEIVEVPPAKPRTKPKALSYALPLISGDFVVLYDAEDRPDALQLLEAWRRFEASGPALACLQAPLEITNGERGPLPRLFAFEYAALFRGLLPWLSGKLDLLPLGGTSNHLRVSALHEVGGWDPYNVTEDADLGTRLARHGYRTETISLPTLEDAPETLAAWLPQRTRWFKGWLQTYLVHMRDPVALFRQLGFRSFALVQILFAGLVLSALIHPLLIVAALYLFLDLAAQAESTGWKVALLTVDLLNIVCGYTSFLLLGWYAQKKADRKGYWKIVLMTPVYWMMLSTAAWRSVLQLWRNPHHWEKTPHFRTRHAAAFERFQVPAE